MCNLPFGVKSAANAEFMSPGGRMTKLPFVKVGAFVVAEFEPIVNLVESKGVSLSKWLDEDQKSDMRAYISLVEKIFTCAEVNQVKIHFSVSSTTFQFLDLHKLR